MGDKITGVAGKLNIVDFQHYNKVLFLSCRLHVIIYPIMKKIFCLLAAIVTLLYSTGYSADNIIKIKSKPRFEFRREQSPIIADGKESKNLLPLNIWLIVKNNKETYDIKIGQAWPKHHVVLNATKLDETKTYTFIIGSVNKNGVTDYELLRVYDKEALIYKKANAAVS